MHACLSHSGPGTPTTVHSSDRVQPGRSLFEAKQLGWETGQEQRQHRAVPSRTCLLGTLHWQHLPRRYSSATEPLTLPVTTVTIPGWPCPARLPGTSKSRARASDQLSPGLLATCQLPGSRLHSTPSGTRPSSPGILGFSPVERGFQRQATKLTCVHCSVYLPHQTVSSLRMETAFIFLVQGLVHSRSSVNLC